MGKRLGNAFVVAVILAGVLAAVETQFFYPCDGWWDCIIKSTIL